MSHTKGPWKVVRGIDDPDVRLIEGPSGWGVALVSVQAANAEMVANARLISAAPDLYLAAQYLVSAADGPPLSDKDRASTIYAATELARAAIKKARGEE